jgi:hypothetical protein
MQGDGRRHAQPEGGREMQRLVQMANKIAGRTSQTSIRRTKY